MKMKPLPRLILIIAAVGAIFYGINAFMGKQSEPFSQTAGQATANPTPQVPQVAPADQAPTAVAPQAAAADPVPMPSTSNDNNAGTNAANAGLSNLLNSGSKK